MRGLEPEELITNAEARQEESLIEGLRQHYQREWQRIEKQKRWKGRVLGMGILAVIGFIVWLLLR